MKVKDPIKFVGGVESAKELLLSMELYLKNNTKLKNCWVSYGGKNECFITPYQCVYSTSYKRIKEALNDH